MTDDDTLDQQLRDLGVRWRESLPETPGVQHLALPPRPAHRDRAWLAAAVIVALAVGATVWATQSLGGTEHTPSGSPSRSAVAPWAPLDPTVPQFADAEARYSAVKASGDLDLSGRGGDRLKFAITLTSPTRVSLEPCPDFTISEQIEWDDFWDEQHALNCTGVPFKDSAGKPYLPANQPVTFAMELDAPIRSLDQITWHLDVPNGPPAVVGSFKLLGAAGETASGAGFCAVLAYGGRNYELAPEQPGTGVARELGKAQGGSCGAGGDREVQVYTANEQPAEEALTVSYDDDVLVYVPEHSAELVPVPYPDVLSKASDEVRASDNALVRRFAQFAVRPSVYRNAVPFADQVKVGLGPNLRTIARSTLGAESSWTLSTEGFAGQTGDVNVLDVLRDHLARRLVPTEPTVPDLQVAVGDHPRCAGPAGTVPAGLEDLRHVAIQTDPETIDSCLNWFAIDLYVDQAGRVAAVSMDLWEP